MPLITRKSNNAYANNYRENEVASALLSRLEPDVSPLTRCHIDADIMAKDQNNFDATKYQNACIYVTYSDNTGNKFLLVTLAKPRGVKDGAANKFILTPGGRRDRDQGFAFTALKEMEEETGLTCDFITANFPEAKFGYLKTMDIKGKRGFFSFEQQLYCYHLDLGQLNTEQSADLAKLVKGYDDVEFAEFINISDLCNDNIKPSNNDDDDNDEDDKLTNHPINTKRLLKGAKQEKPILPAIIGTLKEIYSLNQSTAYSHLKFVYDQLSDDKEKLPVLLNMLYANNEQHQKGAIITCLLLCATLQDIIKASSSNPSFTAITDRIISQDVALTLEDVAKIQREYDAIKKNRKFSIKSTQDSAETLNTLKNPKLSNEQRFASAQTYMINHPEKDLSRAIKQVIIGNTMERHTLKTGMGLNK